MTPQHVALVRHSHAALAPIAAEAAALFYANLFRHDPSLRALFRDADLEAQGARLMTMIGQAVALLDRPATLLPVLRTLGARHGGYGVQPSHYATVGTALLETLEQGLGGTWNDALRDAWGTVYGLIATTMQEGAAGLGAVPSTARRDAAPALVD